MFGFLYKKTTSETLIYSIIKKVDSSTNINPNNTPFWVTTKKTHLYLKRSPIFSLDMGKTELKTPIYESIIYILGGRAEFLILRISHRFLLGDLLDFRAIFTAYKDQSFTLLVCTEYSCFFPIFFHIS